MKFCSQCGNDLKGKRFCTRCGFDSYSEQTNSKMNSFTQSAKVQNVSTGYNSNLGMISSRKPGKKGIMLIGAIAAACLLVFGYSSFSKPGGLLAMPVDEKCDWCSNRPSYAYPVSDGKTSYVCDEHRTHCVLCGDTPVVHEGENLLNMKMFLCEDCWYD